MGIGGGVQSCQVCGGVLWKLGPCACVWEQRGCGRARGQGQSSSVHGLPDAHCPSARPDARRAIGRI
jgi:hypothetical protein